VLRREIEVDEVEDLLQHGKYRIDYMNRQ